MTNEELLSVAEIVERLVARFHKQADDHEAKMVEHRAAFGARTKADAETIDRLHTERDALRAEVAELKTQLERLTSWAAKNQAARETLQTEIERLKSQMAEQEVSVVEVINERNEAWERCDALRAEVAALQERLRASIARGDFAQMEVAALKSQTKHPVKVGAYVKRLTGFNTTPAGEIGRVTRVDDDADAELEYEVKRPNGETGVWCAKNCEPCDPPMEATHDTEAGKAVAEAAVKTEPVADEIKVGDVVEVFQSTASCTFKTDIGTRGTVLQLDDSCVDTAPLDGFLAPKCNHVALCDVWKVTT